jgi:hypothetical protein
VSPPPAARDLTTEDLAILARARDPLRAWLRDAHGRRGLRDGALGVASAAIGLVALLHLDMSPLVALLHLLLALGAAGFAARRAAHAADAAQPFISPLHALACFEAVIAIHGPRPFGARRPRLPAEAQPHAWIVVPGALPAGTPGPLQAARRPRLPPIRGVLLVFFGTMAIFMLPLAQAAAALFDRWDWSGLAALLAINAALLWTAWGEARPCANDAPWDRDWALEAPAIGRLLFWKHYRMLPLGLALIVGLLLITMGMHARSDAPEGAHFVRTLEARLRPVAIGLFAGSGMLNLLLLAAPWHARRKIGAIDLDVAAARRQ